MPANLDVAAKAIATTTKVDSNWYDLILIFFQNNWFNISTWIVGIVLAIFLYFLQSKRANSAYLEKIKYAKKEIIDTLESYIINDLNVSEEMILNLKFGAERSHKIIIEKDWTSISMLQDISYRLQTSRHLSVTQKLKYSNVLDSLILEFMESNKFEEKLNYDEEIKNLTNKIIEEIPSHKTKEIKMAIMEIATISKNSKHNDVSNKTMKLEMILKSAFTATIMALLITGAADLIDSAKTEPSKSIIHINSNSDGSLLFVILAIISIIITILVFLIRNIKIKTKP